MSTTNSGICRSGVLNMHESEFKRRHLERMLKYQEVADEMAKQNHEGAGFFRVLTLACNKLRKEHRLSVTNAERTRLAFVLGSRFTFRHSVTPPKAQGGKAVQVALVMI